MTQRRSSDAGRNEGIQGTVHAEVIAVGRGAQAVKVGHSGADTTELKAVIAELRQAVRSLSLAPAAQEALETDLKKIEHAAEKPEAEREKAAGALESFTGKLKMVGVVVTQAAAIAEPLKKIVGLLRVPLAAIGLS